LDAKAFELALLRLIHETNVPLERGRVAYHLGLTLDEAEKHLDAMAVRGVLELEYDDAGNVFYTYPNRPPAAPPPSAPPADLGTEAATRAALAAHRAVQAVIKAERAPEAPVPFYDGVEPIPRPLAALASILPGAGHFTQKRIAAGIAWMLATAAGYVVYWPAGAALHGLCALDALRR